MVASIIDIITCIDTLEGTVVASIIDIITCIDTLERVQWLLV